MCGTLLKFFNITQMVFSINCRSGCHWCSRHLGMPLENSLHSKNIFTKLNSIAMVYPHEVELPKTFSAWKITELQTIYKPNGLTMLWKMKCVRNFILYSINLQNQNCSLNKRAGRNFYHFCNPMRVVFFYSTYLYLNYFAIRWSPFM